MGFGGGGGGQTTQFNPEPSNPYPQLQRGLVNASQDALAYFRPFGVHGAGYQMANQSPLGQIYTPGPNQSLFGNPYTTTGHQPGFGNSPQYPSQIGFGGSAGGGSGGGGSTNSDAGAKLSGYVPPGVGNLPAGRGYTHSSDLLGALRSALATQVQPPTPGAALPPAPSSGLPYWANPGATPPGVTPPAPPAPAPQPEQTGPNTPNNAPPPPPEFNQNTIGGDPFGIAAGNAPVDSGGNPQTLEQMQQLQQQIQFQNALNGVPQGGK